MAYTDTFASDQNPLTAPWATAPSSNGMYASSGDAGGSTPSAENCSYYSGGTFAASHYSKVSLGTAAGFKSGATVCVNGSDSEKYYVLWDTGTNEVTLSIRNSAGSFTDLHAAYSVTTGAGTTLELQINSSTNTLTPIVNGTPLEAVVDSTTTGGKAGIFTYSTSQQITDWEGGDVGGATEYSSPFPAFRRPA